MTKSDIIQQLRCWDNAHRFDKDGGYGLVRVIRRWASELDVKNHDTLVGALLELIFNQDETLWGVALEVLVEEDSQQVGDKLANMLEQSNLGGEWKDHIVLALLRVKHYPSITNCIKHIEMSLDNDRRLILPVLAALSHLSTETCLMLAARYFGRVLKCAPSVDRHRGYIPAFIRHFVEVDEKLVDELISRTRLIDHTAANSLVAMIDDYLARGVLQREVGHEKVKNLRRRIRSL